jgi:hypothetical protein
MNRVLALVVLLAALVLSIAVGTSFAVPGVQPTLLSRYDGYAIDNWATFPDVSRYYPRTFASEMILPDAAQGEWKISNAGDWSGWDVFNFANRGSERARDRAEFASFTLNRPATVALVWRGGAFVPAWLAAEGWTKATQTVSVARPVTGAQPRTYAVYTKAFPAGQFWLHAPYDTGACGASGICVSPINLPYVLFAEENGQPSVAPVVPEGNEVPVANTTCPAWVHDQYVTPGPDGQLYPTWHPAIDPVYWCYFRHEHGSDPRHVFPDGSFTPAYDYLTHHTGYAPENHWGNKSHAFQNVDGYWFYVTQHVGTTGVGRANTCLQRFHHVEILVRNAERTETLAHLSFMADYGRSLVSHEGPNVPYAPSACPTGNADTELTTSVPTRKIPNAAEGRFGYEPWQFSRFAYRGIGLTGAFTVNTSFPLDVCPNTTCDVPHPVAANSGTGRILQATELRITDPGLGVNGEFYTDARGQALTRALPGSVKQYIKPGLDLPIRGTGSIANSHWVTGHWGDVLTVIPSGFDVDTEGSVRETHGPN